MTFHMKYHGEHTYIKSCMAIQRSSDVHNSSLLPYIMNTKCTKLKKSQILSSKNNVWHTHAHTLSLSYHYTVYENL